MYRNFKAEKVCRVHRQCMDHALEFWLLNQRESLKDTAAAEGAVGFEELERHLAAALFNTCVVVVGGKHVQLRQNN